MSRIRASIAGLVTSEEYNRMLRQGILSSQQELYDILDKLSRILLHQHNRRCMVVKKRRLSTGIVAIHETNDCNQELEKWHCKVPDNRLLSPNPARHEFIEIQAVHSKLALEVLSKLDMIQIHQDSDLMPVAKDKALIARHHVPPTSGDDGILLPVLGTLAVLNPCTDNAQYLDSFGVSRYLATYVASVNECQRVYI